MILTVELTLYPFNESYIPPIKTTIERLNTYEGVKVHTFPTATVLMGDYDIVMEALKDCMAWSHREFGRCVFIAKFIPGYEALK